MNRQTDSILIVEDDRRNSKALSELLQNHGFSVNSVTDGRDALIRFKTQPHQLIIANLILPIISGLELLKAIKAISPTTPVLIMAGQKGSIQSAVEAMQEGASDFLLIPFSSESMLLSVKKALFNYTPLRANPSDLCRGHGFRYRQELITINSKVIKLLESAKNIARSNSTVLIQGESGTGKELLAAYIVQCSGRSNQPYVAMNCAALPDNLAESELFGHEKGAFTGAFQRQIGKFEQADKGTILLDEISELSLALQAKLLRVLQEKVVDRLGGTKPVAIDTRVIATCNVDLKKAVETGRFREDLYYRINVLPFNIPPLRERADDIAVLADHFIQKISGQNGKWVEKISDAALTCLKSRQWKGNVRELGNVIERAVLVADGTTILPDHLLLDADRSEVSQDNSPLVGTTVKDMEKTLIFKTLEHVNENRTHAAKLLGISIRTLRNKLKEYRAESLQWA
jgi:DNA-binding NtrC family response regulator